MAQLRAQKPAHVRLAQQPRQRRARDQRMPPAEGGASACERPWHKEERVTSPQRIRVRVNEIIEIANRHPAPTHKARSILLTQRLIVHLPLG